MTDSLSLDGETVSAQLEVCPEAPERVLACGHTKRTHRTDAARCRLCGESREVLTPTRAREEAEVAVRAAELSDDITRLARERAATFRKFADTKRGEGHE